MFDNDFDRFLMIEKAFFFCYGFDFSVSFMAFNVYICIKEQNYIINKVLFHKLFFNISNKIGDFGLEMRFDKFGFDLKLWK